MSVDSDEAIEKLAQYRATSKKPKFKAEKDAQIIEDSLLRKFFLKYYWFNALVVLTLMFAMLIGGWMTELAGIWVLFIILALVVFSRQTFRTISRIEYSNGRNTTLDDMFIIILIAGMFFFFSIFNIIPQNLFVIVHITLSVIWLLQIIFVNYLKPELGVTKMKQHAPLETSDSLVGQLKVFINKERGLVIGISLILGLIIALV